MHFCRILRVTGEKAGSRAQYDEKNRIRRSLGWKAGANVILIAVIIGATAVCISYRAYRQNLEDQMTQTAENLSCAAAAQVTAESIDSYLASGEKDEAYRK